MIDDVTGPTPDTAVLADVTAQCEVTTLTAPSATDNCGGTVTVTNNASLPISGEGTTTILTWTYEDVNGKTTTQTQKVVIDDITAPLADVTTLADISVECEVTSLTTPSATDNCGTAVVVTNDATLPISDNTTITWTYDDGNGNTSTQTQNVIITDSTAPVVDAATLTDVTADCSLDTSTLTTPTATDNCMGAIAGTTPNIAITLQGTTVITWTYDDSNGNSSTQTQNVVINDVTAPTPDIASLVDVLAQCKVTSLLAPTATDNCSGTITVINDAILPISSQGTTMITWTYDDGNGNTSTQTQNIIIDDITSPTPDVANLSVINADCEVTSLTEPTVTDNCGGMVTVSNNADLPITTQGTTVITWTYDDGHGNTTSQTQNVVIDDVAVPVLADCPVDFNVTPDGSGNYTILDYSTLLSFSDNCTATVDLITSQSPIAGSIVTEGTVNTVTFTVTDAEGNNSSVCTFDITVEGDVLGITDNVLSDAQVQLYPNPSSQFIYINTNNIQLNSANVFDVLGRIVKTIDFNQGQQEYKIDVSNLEIANYFVKLNSETGSVVKRFIKN